MQLSSYLYIPTGKSLETRIWKLDEILVAEGAG